MLGTLALQLAHQPPLGPILAQLAQERVEGAGFDAGRVIANDDGDRVFIRDEPEADGGGAEIDRERAAIDVQQLADAVPVQIAGGMELLEIAGEQGAVQGIAVPFIRLTVDRGPVAATSAVNASM